MTIVPARFVVDEVLAEHPGRRIVVRSGELVVKVFEPAEQGAFEREAAGLRALAGTGLSVPLVEVGERWVATTSVAGVMAMGAEVENAGIHAAIGGWLARLHAVGPLGLPAWPVVDRLRALLDSPPAATCPPALAAAVGRLVEPLLGAVVDGAFVHGDWGTANVLVDPTDRLRVLAIMDFEDSHHGDPAEDVKWQVLAGPTSEELVSMRSSYVAAGGRLGADAVERLVVAGAEICLEVLGWDLRGEARGRMHGRCLATLDELVAGVWPDWSE
jgi:aminoglycoside phosphotransferase (APT) family kinase protein